MSRSRDASSGARLFTALARDAVAQAVRDGVRGGRRRALDRAISIDDLRCAARGAVPGVVFDFVDGGANDEQTLRANVADFTRVAVRPRVLRNVQTPASGITALGTELQTPILGAPTGLSGLVHSDGEVALARAVHSRGSVYVLSAMASYTLEEVRSATDGPLWFQVYIWRDRGFVRSLIERAAAVGCAALVLTVDVPVAGSRERDRRNGFGIPPRLTAKALAQGLRRPGWSRSFLSEGRIVVAHAAGAEAPAESAATLTEYINTQFDPTVTWEDVDWIRELWDGPIAIKGVLSPDDARIAVSVGADAVIVSNHGGRQLDGASSSIAALPEVTDAVGGEAEVYVDGGIRRGGDVVKALSLGARGVLAGRALLYGLAAGGELGAGKALDILHGELRTSLMLSGCADVGELSTDWLADPAAARLPPKGPAGPKEISGLST